MSENNSNADSTLALVIVIMALGFAIPWLLNNYLISYYVYFLHYFNFLVLSIIYEINDFKLISENVHCIFFWLDWAIVDATLPKDSILAILNDSYSKLLDVNTNSVSTISSAYLDSSNSIKPDFVNISRLVNSIFSPLYMLLVIMLVYKLLTSVFFNKVFSLDTFAMTMAEGFPELLPVVYDNPQNYPIDSGPWRMSPKIKDYLTEQACIISYNKDGKEFFKLDINQITKLMNTQLGEKWSGFDNLDTNYRTLAALALPMAISPAKGKDQTYELLEALGYAYSSKPRFTASVSYCVKTIFKTFFSIDIYLIGHKRASKATKRFFGSVHGVLLGLKETRRQKKYRAKSRRLVDQFIKSYSDSPRVKEVISKHAYNKTVISALITLAREGGVLPSCSCLWLKKEDRNLFYVFNNIGRQVAWIEVVGYWAHYLFEREVGAPFPYPKVSRGVDAIDKALYDSFYNYEPLNDYSEEL